MGTPRRWSDEFLVNAVTAFDQSDPAITVLADGRLAVVYTDRSGDGQIGDDSDGAALRVQILNADGSLALGPVQVNTVVTGDQSLAEIAALPGGGFVVVYLDESQGADSGGDDPSDAIRMQVFDSNGVPVGAEVLVNGAVDGAQTGPSVAVLGTGEIVVTYSDAGTDMADTDGGVVAAVFAPDGTKVVSDFQVNATTTGTQEEARIAALSGGSNFVAVYQFNDGSSTDVWARIFDRSGAVVVDEFRVHSLTTGDQIFADVTGLRGGGFVVTWTDSAGVGSDTSYYGVRAQVFDAYGNARGEAFDVNTATTLLQMQSRVLALSDGRFVIAWVDYSAGADTGGDDASAGAVRAQVFRANGAKDGDEFLVNTVTTNSQADLSMTETADGRLVITYLDGSYGVETGSDDTTAAVRATIFELRSTAQDWTGTDGDESFAGTRWNDVLDGAGGDDRLYGAGGKDGIAGGTGKDELSGNAGQDKLWGGAGDDDLYGGRGDDKLWGEAGADILVGGAGDDTLNGGAQGDRITGGAGRDKLIGGAGYDIFIYLDDSDSGAGWNRRDKIVDFERGVDVIDLSAIDAAPLTIPEDAFVFIGKAGFSGSVGELRFEKKHEKTLIEADLDGDGNADFQILLKGRTGLSEDDFFL